MNGEEVKRLREKKGYTQEQFAELLGIHRTYVNQIENNKKTPSFTLMVRIAEALGVSVKKFL